MAALALIISPRGPAGGVLDLLQDYSSLGLLAPFLWIDPAGVSSSGVAALEIRGGRQRGTTLEDELARHQPTRVRVGVLVPKVGEAPAVPGDVEHLVSDLVQSRSGGAHVDRIRCIVTRPESGSGAGDLAREGWHNLVVVPEDSQGPGRAYHLLRPSTDPVEIARHAAPVVAAVLGLWRDLEDGPLDGVPVLPGRTVRSLRSFYRRLDAGDLETRLRSHVLSMSRGAPLPHSHGQPAVFVDDVALATRTMAAALWTKHARVLRGPRVQAAEQPVTKIGPFAALRMLFSFVWAAIKNAPAQWYSRTLNEVSSRTAAAVHSSVFGEERAAYQVVVRGVTGSGVPASWEETAESGAVLDRTLTGPTAAPTHEAGASLAQVWRDYVTAALTLADAGPRDPLLPPVQVGTTPGILRSAADCAPSADDDFTDIPGYVAAAVGVSRVAASDVLGQRDLAKRLEHLAHEPATALEADRSRQSLARWQRERERSFSVQVGLELATAFQKVTAEIAHLLAGLGRAAVAEDLDSASRAKQRRLALWMRIVLAAFLLLVVVVVTLGSTETVAWDSLWPWLGWGSGLWLTTSLVLFFHQQRELFRELNRRRQVVAQAEAMQANLRQALQDQRRLAGAYHQFLGWSRVLGAFLRAPFGEERSSDEREVEIGEGLPLSTRIGRAILDEDRLEEAAVVIRRDVFTTGWLTGPFEATLQEAGRRLRTGGYELREQPDRIYGAPGGPEDVLSHWGRLLESEGAGRASADVLWAGVIESLVGPRSEIGEKLRGRVAPADSPQETLSYDEFMAGVHEPPAATARHRFDNAVLASEARAHVAHVVERNVAESRRDGLGTVAVLTQVGEGLPAYEYALDVDGGQTPPAADPDWVF